MFAAFVGLVEPLGLLPYPESCGHDLVLEVSERFPHRGGTADALEVGDLVAVEGKLRANLHLLAQAAPHDRGYRANLRMACDFYAVLSPAPCGGDFGDLARMLGIVQIQLSPEALEGRRGWRLPPFLDEHRAFGTRPTLPPRVQMPAGSPSPRSITPWKVAAVRLCLRGTGAELRSEDFKADDSRGNVRPRTFVERGWMVPDRREGRAYVYRLVDSPTRPDVAYPEVAAALRERA